MARKLDKFPSGLKPERPTMYPWAEWLDGSVWELHHGEDFKVSAESIKTQARVVARTTRGGHVEAMVFNNKKSVVLQFHPGPAEDCPIAEHPPSVAQRIQAKKDRGE